MRNYKQGRIEDNIQKKLALNIRDLNDPGLGFLTISKVIITADLSVARIYITILEEEKQLESLKILNKAANLLRYNLAKSLKLRHTPRLEFFYDHGLDDGRKMSALLDSL